MELLQELIPYIVPAVAIIVSYLFSKYLNITITKNKIEELLFFIINIITDVEQKKTKLKGYQKQQLVVNKVKKELPEKELNLLEKTFKTVDVAVEKAFQLSHLGSGLLKLGKKLL